MFRHLFVALLIPASAFAHVNHETEETFRTPAKRYGSAYSVKLTLKRDVTDFTFPVWVKPDQAVSTLDKNLLRDLAWTYNDLSSEDVELSNERIDHPDFKDARSDWAFYPDYPRICCYGVIGQDILKHFRVKFDPQPPAHLEWTRIVEHEGETHPAPSKHDSNLNAELKRLFDLKSEKVKVNDKTIDLSEVPYIVDLSHHELEFEPPRKILGAEKNKVRENPIIHFTFLPESRLIRIDGVEKDVAKTADAVGIRKGLAITELNYTSTSHLDKFEILNYFRGKSVQKLEITLLLRPKTMKVDRIKKEVIFDFQKGQFFD